MITFPLPAVPETTDLYPQEILRNLSEPLATWSRNPKHIAWLYKYIHVASNYYRNVADFDVSDSLDSPSSPIINRYIGQSAACVVASLIENNILFPVADIGYLAVLALKSDAWKTLLTFPNGVYWVCFIIMPSLTGCI